MLRLRLARRSMPDVSSWISLFLPEHSTASGHRQVLSITQARCFAGCRRDGPPALRYAGRRGVNHVHRKRVETQPARDFRAAGGTSSAQSRVVIRSLPLSTKSVHNLVDKHDDILVNAAFYLSLRRFA
jgi:hypothetical protein